MTRRSKTGLQGEDLLLWAKVAETVDTIDKDASRQLAESLKSSSLVPATPAIPMSEPVEPEKPVRVTRREPRHTYQKPAENSGLDRRTTQRMTRGQIKPEARIDLHGMGAEMARHRLLGFLASARKDQCRTVLVITGKGHSPYARHTLHGRDHFHTPEREGRLRRLLPEWLSEPQFSAHVAGYQPAHPKHGGGGAFYLRLRRAK